MPAPTPSVEILAYFCAGRPILAAMPANNLAARRIAESGAGVVVAPDDAAAFRAAADKLVVPSPARHAMAAKARAHAERTFRIDRITDRFEASTPPVPS